MELETNIKFRLHDGTERVLEEVRFVRSLKCNLISLNEFKKKGYMFKGEQGILKVMRGSMVVTKDVRKDNLYVLESVVVFGSLSTAKNNILSKTKILYIRLGHVNKKSLFELKK